MKKFWILLLLLLPIVMAKKIEIYSAYTTHPSFLCPQNASKCELYQLVDSMSRNITPPKLVLECQPGWCRYVNDVGNSFGFRVLPGDIVFGAGLFKGYMVVEGEEPPVETTVETTTTIITPTTIISCHNRQFHSCLSAPNCKWVGSIVSGYCTNISPTLQGSTTSQTTTTVENAISCVVEKRCLSSLFGRCVFYSINTKCYSL